MTSVDRAQFNFVASVRQAFGFLESLGFKELETTPTLVLYGIEDVEVDVYHGRGSYEIGAGVRCAETRFDLSSIMTAVSPEIARGYRRTIATSPESVRKAVEDLSVLFKQHCADALRAEPRFLELMTKKRQEWAEAYALEVLAGTVRPEAEEYFRAGDYAKAAGLYAQILERLSPAEKKKLALARKRSKGGQ